VWQIGYRLDNKVNYICRAAHFSQSASSLQSGNFGLNLNFSNSCLERDRQEKLLSTGLIRRLFQYIYIYIQKNATLQSLFYLETALHVSGGTSTHHQECKQLYLQHLVFVTSLLLSAAIVEELELVWVCCGWRTSYVHIASLKPTQTTVKTDFISLVKDHRCHCGLWVLCLLFTRNLTL